MDLKIVSHTPQPSPLFVELTKERKTFHKDIQKFILATSLRHSLSRIDQLPNTAIQRVTVKMRSAKINTPNTVEDDS